MVNTVENIAFIDGQNLYRGLDWNLDYKKFRVYLRDKYHVQKVLVPNLRFASSLYKNHKNLEAKYFACIHDLRGPLEHKKEPPKHKHF